MTTPIAWGLWACHTQGPLISDSRALAHLVAEDVRAGDVVLVKGSLGSRMSEVITSLIDLETPVRRVANGE